MHARFTRAIAGVLGAVLLASCSSSSAHHDASTSTTSGSWDPAAVATANRVVADIGHAFPGQCRDAAQLPHADYVANPIVGKTNVPLAVVDCSAVNETIEIDVAATPAARAAFVQARAQTLCERARKGNAHLPGLHWTVGDNWAVQTDTEGGARVLADALHGSYVLSACPGAGQVDWEPAAVARLQTLATKLANDAAVGCKNFVLLDRELYSRNPAYAGRLPAAYGTCLDSKTGTILLAAFSPRSVSRDRFITTEARLQCGATKTGITAVRGDDWAVLTTGHAVAPAAAGALNGVAEAPAC